MTEKFPSTAMSGTNPSVFTHGELRQVLSAYAEGVLHKNWKDYAIASEKNQTTFCVIERGMGEPMAVIYSISRTCSQKASGRDFYRVFDRDKQILRTESFMEALQCFRECGIPQNRKSKKLKIIK